MQRGLAPQGADPPAGIPGDWWTAVRCELQAREYQVSPSPLGLQAPNRAQNLRTYFRDKGIEIVPRTGPDAWSWGWRTVAFGRQGAMQGVRPMQPEYEGPRVTYAHPDFEEWYLNSPAGLEQGFTFHEPPAGSGPLRIAGIVTGGLTAQLTREGSASYRSPAAGDVLCYGQVLAFDAHGKHLWDLSSDRR
jgi:hypothetical protein